MYFAKEGSDVKFFKKFFNQVFFIALAFLLQFLLILAVVSYFNQYYIVFQVLQSLLGIAVFVYIINKKESPEFKLPWLFLFMAFPVFGLVVYLLLADQRLSGKQNKRLVKAEDACKLYLVAPEKGRKEMNVRLGAYAGTDNYLVHAARTEGDIYNKVDFFPVGEAFFADLLTELRKAEKFIFMEYFIIDPGKMWNAVHEILLEKVKAGVEVRVIYDDIGTLGMVGGNFAKTLCKEGIRCVKFNPFRPLVSGICNNRDHRKITVVDGKVGYTGGVNLGDEYINENKRLGHWKDTAVKIRGAAAGTLTAMFLQMFDMTARKTSDYGKYLDVAHEKFDEPGCVHPFGDGPQPFYGEQVGENNYINIIAAAKDYVWITTPYLIPDHNLTTALRNAALRGVDVRIVTPHIPDKKIILNMTRSNYTYLLQAGVKIYEYTPGFIHAKQMLSDDRVAFVGTINMDYRSLVHHYECGALLVDVPCLKDIREDFESTLAVSEEITPYNFKMGFFASLFNSFLTLFAPLF